MPSWLSIHAPKRFDQLAVPQKIRDQFIRASLSGDPPHLLITGPAGVGKQQHGVWSHDKYSAGLEIDLSRSPSKICLARRVQ